MDRAIGLPRRFGRYTPYSVSVPIMRSLLISLPNRLDADNLGATRVGPASGEEVAITQRPVHFAYAAQVYGQSCLVSA